MRGKALSSTLADIHAELKKEDLHLAVSRNQTLTAVMNRRKITFPIGHMNSFLDEKQSKPPCKKSEIFQSVEKVKSTRN